MNSNECKLKIKVIYKDKIFEKESEDIIPLQKIKEISIEKLDIIKEDVEFINFEYHSNKENKNHPIEKEEDIIKYADEDSSGNLFCNLELLINNQKRITQDNILSNEIKVEKIESKKSSNKDLNKINEIPNLKKENSEKEKLINNLKEDIKNKENEIKNNNSEINNLSSELEKAKKESENANNQKNNIVYKDHNVNDNKNKFIEKTDDNYKDLLNANSTFKGDIEKLELNKKIVNGNKKDEKIKENEKNKNIEFIF